MLGVAYKAFGYALVALTLSLPMVAREFSSTFQDCISRQGASETGQQQEKSAPGILIARAISFECTVDFLNMNGTAITAVETALIAFFTFTLWGATRAQRLHEREVTRAYVSGGGPLDVQTDRFILTIDNYGQTPAYLIEFALEFCEIEHIPDVPRYATRGYERTRLRATIAPGTRSQTLRIFPVPPDRTVVYGRFWYRDIWRKGHSFGFILEAGSDHVPREASAAYTDPT